MSKTGSLEARVLERTKKHTADHAPESIVLHSVINRLLRFLTSKDTAASMYGMAAGSHWEGEGG